jgi:hypothetical protein
MHADHRASDVWQENTVAMFDALMEAEAEARAAERQAVPLLRRLYAVADSAVAYGITHDPSRRPDLLVAHAALDDTRRFLDAVAWAEAADVANFAAMLADRYEVRRG